MVTALKDNSLMSASKFLDANYITVLTLEEVLIYNVNEVKLLSPGQEMLIGWICKTSGLCRVPLKPKVEK